MTRNRTVCNDGVSLSIQASKYHYCSPREDDAAPWYQVEVGYIRDINDKPLTPPDSWQEYADGDFPSSVYGYVPVELVAEFIKLHGGVKTGEGLSLIGAEK